MYLFKNTHYFVNIKKKCIILLFISICIFSCDKNENIQEIPSYLSVSNINLVTNSNQGSNTHKITDVWLYVNDQFKGAYELPSTIPLLHKDTNNIKIFAGIKDNGIASTRVRYHFYKSFEKNVFLVEDSIVNIQPSFRYTDNATIEYENFEGVGTNIDTTLNSEVDFEIKTENENNFAYAHISGDYLKFEAATDDFENLPQQGSPVYLEVDYQSNHTALIGAYINNPTSVINRDLVWISPKEEDWNKIYINMTKTVSEALGNNSIKFYINVFRTDTTKEAWIKFDNLKIIY